MAKVREIQIPTARLSTSAPWHFAAFAIALIPAAAISFAAGNRFQVISAGLSSASAVLSLALMREVFKKRSLLVVPIGIALGCSVAFVIPYGAPVWISPLVVCIASVLSQLMSLQSSVRINTGIAALALALAARYALGFTVAPVPDILAGIDPDKIIHDLVNALRDEGKNAYPAYSPFALIPAAVILLAMGVIRAKSLLYTFAGSALVIAVLFLTGHEILLLAGWRIALAPFIFVSLFFFHDPLSSSKTYAGRSATSFLSGALWSLVFLQTGNVLLATASILAINLSTPLIDKITVPRPFGPVEAKK